MLVFSRSRTARHLRAADAGCRPTGCRAVRSGRARLSPGPREGGLGSWSRRPGGVVLGRAGAMAVLPSVPRSSMSARTVRPQPDWAGWRSRRRSTSQPLRPSFTGPIGPAFAYGRHLYGSDLRDPDPYRLVMTRRRSPLTPVWQRSSPWPPTSGGLPTSSCRPPGPASASRPNSPGRRGPVSAVNAISDTPEKAAGR